MGISRTAALAALLAVVPLAAQAGPKDDVLQALAKCADIADRDARIACFDAQTPQLRAAVAQPIEPAAPPPVASAPAAEAPPPAAEVPPPSGSQATTILSSLNPFSDSGPGSDRPSAQQLAYQPLGQELLPITIAAPHVDVEPGMSFTVTLANGQVWTEHKGHHETPRFKGDGSDVVTIERGLIGGYDMYVQGASGQFKIDRVK